MYTRHAICTHRDFHYLRLRPVNWSNSRGQETGRARDPRHRDYYFTALSNDVFFSGSPDGRTGIETLFRRSLQQPLSLSHCVCKQIAPRLFAHSSIPYHQHVATRSRWVDSVEVTAPHMPQVAAVHAIRAYVALRYFRDGAI